MKIEKFSSDIWSYDYLNSIDIGGFFLTNLSKRQFVAVFSIANAGWSKFKQHLKNFVYLIFWNTPPHRKYSEIAHYLRGKILKSYFITALAFVSANALADPFGLSKGMTL